MAGFAHVLGWAVVGGKPLEDALSKALGTVRVRGGHGGAICLARDGRFAVGFDTIAMARGWRDSSGAFIRPLRAELRAGRSSPGCLASPSCPGGV